MGFLGLGGKSSRRERRSEAGKNPQPPTNGGKSPLRSTDPSRSGGLVATVAQSRMSPVKAQDNAPSSVPSRPATPSRENHHPNLVERIHADSTTPSKPEGGTGNRSRSKPSRQNEAIQLRNSIVTDRRKSRVNTPAPTNPNPTQHNAPAPWSYESISRALDRADWIRLESQLWQVGRCLYLNQELRRTIFADRVLNKSIEAAACPLATRGVCQKALYIVSQVSLLDDAEASMVKAGVIPLLKMVLVSSVDSHTIGSAVRALRNLLSSSEDTALQVGREQCALPLLDILKGAHGVTFACKETEIVVRREAAAAIANLTQFGPKYQNQVARAQGVVVLVAPASTSVDDETKYHAVKALANIASEPRLHASIVQHGVLTEAQRILHSCKELETVAEAARLVGNVAGTSTGRAHVVDSGGVEELIERLVRSAPLAPAAPVPDVVNACHNVCLSEKASITASLRGAVPVLVDLASRSKGTVNELREAAENTLINIAQTGQKANVLKAIEQSADPDIQSSSETRDLRARVLDAVGDQDHVDVPSSVEHLSRVSKQATNNARGDAGSSAAQRFQPSGRMVAVKGDREENKKDTAGRVKQKETNLHEHQFAVGQVLGKGGYGTVYLAQKLGTPGPKLVAIKQFHVADAQQSRLATKEQRIWEGLDHPNVVKYEGCFIGEDGGLNLVVEYIDGWSLAKHLSRYSAFPEDLVAEITRQILFGLEYLHANGVIHRDLKPANVMVSQDGKVKITDFGVSSSTNIQTLGQGNTMVGTPWYIAPEIVEQRPYTFSVDIWSLGCTILELATGKRPYHELAAMQALFRMVQDRRPPIPPSLSPNCRSFLELCWTWDPQQRPGAAVLKSHPFLAGAIKR